MKWRHTWQKQKGQARFRGIDFLLSFDEWLFVWELSGRLRERGRRKGQYVMARHGDCGPYAIDNVDIVLCSKNCADGNIGPSPLRGRTFPQSHCDAISKGMMGHTMTPERRAKIGAANSRALTGKPWSAVRRAAYRPQIVSEETRAKIRARHVGRPWPIARRAAYEAKWG